MPTPVVPVIPSRALKGKRTKKILLYVADDGSRESRIKRGKKRSLEMVHNRRPKKEFLLTADLTTMEPFWDAHYDGVTIVQVTHPYTGEVMTGFIDSDLEEQWDATNLVSFSWQFQEA
jgi:hypothetical protein